MMTSVSCASSLSASNSKFTPKTSNNEDNRSKSCNTNCSSNSSCFFKKRKPMNPLAYSLRPAYQKTNNPVKQRVMSAKLLKMRQLQSQLNDANYHLAEVSRENQTLKTLQKRQDKALSKYENTNADLPRLIYSHEEEIRMLTEKNKNLKRNVRDLNEQLKQKEEELVKTRDQLIHLEKLNKDKHLTEREKLKDLMEDYKIKLQKAEEQVTILNRKLLLESKTSKQRLNTEIIKHKQCQKELMQAMVEIDKLSQLLDVKENRVRPKVAKINSIKNEKCQAPVTEVKLEPIVNGLRHEILTKKSENSFKAPIENIRQRLSSNSIKSDVSTDSSRDTSADSCFKSRPTSSLKLEKLPSVHESKKLTAKIRNEDQIENNVESDEEFVQNKNVIVVYDDDEKHNNISKIHQDSEDDDLVKTFQKLKKDKLQEKKLIQETYERKYSDTSSNSEKDIEKMAGDLDAIIKKAVENSQEEFDQNLGNYCSKVLDNVKTCNKVINFHKESLKSSKQDTDAILDSFKQTEKTETKLKKSFFNMDDDMEFVDEILNEEYKFQKENPAEPNSKSLANLENKRKLLATLRAIDNGDSVEGLDVDEQKRSNIMTELFSNVAH